MDKSDTGGHGGGHDEVWAVATATFFKDSQCVSTNGAGIRVNVPRPECHRVPLLDGKGHRTFFALSAGGGIFLPRHDRSKLEMVKNLGAWRLGKMPPTFSGVSPLQDTNSFLYDSFIVEKETGIHHGHLQSHQEGDLQQ